MPEEEKVEESTEEESSAPPKKRSPILMIIGIVVVVLLLGGGGTFFYLQTNSAEASEEDEEVEEVEITDTNIYYDGFQTNVVNLAVSSEYQFMYLKYGFDIELSDTSLYAELNTRLPRLTAAVAGVMSNQDWTEICTPRGRERLGRDALDEINDQLAEGEVIGLYFTTFVAQ